MALLVLAESGFALSDGFKQWNLNLAFLYYRPPNHTSYSNVLDGWQNDIFQIPITFSKFQSQGFPYLGTVSIPFQLQNIYNANSLEVLIECVFNN